MIKTFIPLKRFGTAQQKRNNGLGYYISGHLGMGYQFKYSGIRLFGEFEYLVGKAEQQNLYVEEWFGPGSLSINRYTEKYDFKMMTFKVGVALPFINL